MGVRVVLAVRRRVGRPDAAEPRGHRGAEHLERDLRRDRVRAELPGARRVAGRRGAGGDGVLPGLGVADRAGLTIAWNDANGDRIDIQPNVYGDDIEFRVTYTGPIHSKVVVTGPASQGGGLPINANTDYWLRVSATSTGPGNGQVIVYWSTDGIHFMAVETATGIADLTGLVGVGTAGPHLPHTYFDDFQVKIGVA